MLLLIFPIICFFFLAAGAVIFAIFGLVPSLRKFALSAALWCAAWGPCVVAWLMLAGLALVANGFAEQEFKARPFATISGRLAGWTYVWVAAAGTACFATVVAWLHQAVIRRLTFMLFRLYATLVSAGVGSVYGWTLLLWIGSLQIRFGLFLWIPAMVLLIAGFGFLGYREARSLRGERPRQFAWVTQQEFEGTT